MPGQHAITFQEALDTIESLPEYQQEDLIDIVRRRLIEHRREEIAGNVRKGREEYARGEARKSSVADIMKEIRE